MSQALLDRINELDALISPLATERALLKQQLLEEKSPLKVGDLVEWGNSKYYGRKNRGRVRVIRNWVCGDVRWDVSRIRKNGSEGCNCFVYPYMNPVRIDNL
jgi:hypothetical protein